MIQTRDLIRQDRLLSTDTVRSIERYLKHQERRASEAKLAVVHFDHLEATWRRQMLLMFDKQRRSTLSRLRGRRGHQMIERAPALLNVNDVFDRDHWVTAVHDDLRNLYTQTAELACHRVNGRQVRGGAWESRSQLGDYADYKAAGGTASLTDWVDQGQPASDVAKLSSPDVTVNVLGTTGQILDVQMPEVQEFIDRRTNQLAGQVNDTTYSSIKDSLSEGVGLGESIPQLADRIQTVFDATDLRATTIARTEAISGYNGATHTLFDVYPPDVAAGQEWLATNDDRTRPDHSDADGQQVAAGEQFQVGGESCDYPGDENLSPEQCVNCRCTTLILTPEDMGISPDITGMGPDDEEEASEGSLTGQEDPGGSQVPTSDVFAGAPVAEYSERLADLKGSIKSGIVATDDLNGIGANALDVSKVSFADGTFGVLKQLNADDGMWYEGLADREVLTAQLAGALGADTPATVLYAPDTIMMRFVESSNFLPGSEGGGWNGADVQAKIDDLIASPSGQKLGLLDTLIDNQDRNSGNWLVGQNGNVIGIDHEMARFGDGEEGEISPFSHGLKLDQDVFLDAQARLEDDPSVKEAFREAGRGYWYDEVTGRLDDLIAGKNLTTV